MDEHPGDPLAPAAFGRALKRFLDASLAQAPSQESPLRARVREHLGTDPAELPTLAHALPQRDHPNLQLALDALLARPGWEAEVRGIRGAYGHYHPVSLADVIEAPAVGEGIPPPRTRPLEHVTVELEPGRTISCV